jgi:hypothetical protein
VTTKDVDCKEVRIHLRGVGWCMFTTGNGETKKFFTHTCFYVNSARIVFGPSVRTPCVKPNGESVVFGSSSNPDEGILSLHTHPNEQQIVVRVLDVEWQKRDTVIGEAVLDIEQFAGKQKPQQIALSSNGVATTRMFVFEMSWESNCTFLTDSAGHKAVRLRIHRISGLTTKDRKNNNICVQAYLASACATATGQPRLIPEAGSALPSPMESHKLAAGSHSMPFSFQLPPDLPSSFAQSRCRIAYSVYSSIDAATADASTRHFFSVVQPHAVATMMKPKKTAKSEKLYHQLCIPPFCWLSCPIVCLPSIGQLLMAASTDRYAYAAGDRIKCTLQVTSEWAEARSRITSVEMRLQMIICKAADGELDRSTVNIGDVCHPALHLDDQESGQRDVINGHILVPVLPPSYSGGLASKMTKWGNRCNETIKDAVTWSYRIDVRVRVRVSGETSAVVCCFLC